ncbi:acyl-CoA thioesterase [Pandoraea eparura]|nr:thioesterase family protein [Pandoraea eparura]
MDNDIYGHVNNVTYYSYFDTAVNQHLIHHGVLDIHRGDVVGFVVDSACSYFKPIAFPDALQVGVRVGRIGRSSVRYELAIFLGDDAAPSAVGHFVHVYVSRSTGQSVEVPCQVKSLLTGLMATGSA